MMHFSISTGGCGLGDGVDLLKRLVGKLAISHMHSDLKSTEEIFLLLTSDIHFQCVRNLSVKTVHVLKILILHSDMQCNISSLHIKCPIALYYIREYPPMEGYMMYFNLIYPSNHLKMHDFHERNFGTLMSGFTDTTKMYSVESRDSP